MEPIGGDVNEMVPGYLSQRMCDSVDGISPFGTHKTPLRNGRGKTKMWKKRKTKTAIHWNMRALSHAHGFSSTSFSGKFTKYHFWLTNRAAERIKQPRKTHTHTHSDRQTKAICVHFEVIFCCLIYFHCEKHISSGAAFESSKMCTCISHSADENG